MKIGVVSDTHSHTMPQQLLDDFKKVDLIIHAGDFCSMEDLKTLERIKDVRAVFGNMDDLELRQIFPERDIFKIDGVKIALYHGRGASDKVLGFVKAEFSKDKPDVVIFGHSHHPVNEVIDNVLYFNPGSPTDVVRAAYCSYGVLEIRGGKASGKIIKVER